MARTAAHSIPLRCSMFALALVILLLPLAGCGKANSPDSIMTPLPGTGSQPTAQPAVENAPAGLPAAQSPSNENDLEKSQSQDPQAPLRFTLPTPGPAPISLWRPPLYETPWALGPHDHFYFNRPIASDVVNWPVADYRYGGTFFSSDIVHTGVDIPAPRLTPVLAAGPGRVVWAGYGLYYGNNDPNDPYGLAVTIRHDFGFQGQRLYTVYAHINRSMSSPVRRFRPVRYWGKSARPA